MRGGLSQGVLVAACCPVYFSAQEAGAIDESFIKGISTHRCNGKDMAECYTYSSVISSNPFRSSRAKIRFR